MEQVVAEWSGMGGYFAMRYEDWRANLLDPWLFRLA